MTSRPRIPDRTWGSDDGALARWGHRFAATGLGSGVIRRLAPWDARLLLRTRGRRTLLGPVGAPTLLLETLGRRSGQPRLSPLLFARPTDAADGSRSDDVVVVGSNFGGTSHPGWTANLIAQPEASVHVGGETVPVRARLLEGAEADAAYERMVAVSPVYAEYRRRTDRRMRVFRLTPTAPTDGPPTAGM